MTELERELRGQMAAVAKEHGGRPWRHATSWRMRSQMSGKYSLSTRSSVGKTSVRMMRSVKLHCLKGRCILALVVCRLTRRDAKGASRAE
jgi:hypothetical protein